RALPGERLFCLPSAPKAIAQGCIDASTATSGPHVFAVRLSRARQSQLSRPPHPRPTFVTIASAPLVGTGCMRCSLIFISGKAKDFLFQGLTGFPKIGIGDLPVALFCRSPRILQREIEAARMPRPGRPALPLAKRENLLRCPQMRLGGHLVVALEAARSPGLCRG